MSFLEELYQKGYHPSEHDRPHSMEYELAVQRVQDLEKKIIEKMGAQFMDEYCYAKASQYTLEAAHAYAQGASLVISQILCKHRFWCKIEQNIFKAGAAEAAAALSTK